MTTYYKAIRPDGTSFYDPTFRWVPESGTVEGIIVTHPSPHDDDPSGWLSAATVPTDCTGVRWPCRLLEVEPVEGHPVTAPPEYLPHTRAASAWLVVRELPATDALGPQGVDVAAILDRVSRLTADDARRLAAARDATWDATRGAARDATWDAARDATWDATRGAARDAAWGAARAAAWDATRDATWDATRAAARDATWAATWDAARGVLMATLARDLITPEQYDTLTAPWREVIGND